MDRTELLIHWCKFSKQTLPNNISTKLLRRALAYQVQVKVIGDLPAARRKQLLKLARRSAVSKEGAKLAGSTKHTKLKPGARLIREWNGRNYVVKVVDSGFVWQGQSFTSLSAVARAITGTRWSGPRFFGL